MSREARARFTRSSTSETAFEITPRLAPWVRMWRVSARVSIPQMPGIPCRVSQASSEPSERQLESTDAISRTTKPLTCALLDSWSWAQTP